MNKKIALELKAQAEVVAKRFSRKDREQNFNNEDFKVDEIIPMSDHTACVYYRKTTDKIGAAFFLLHTKWYVKRVEIFFSLQTHTSTVLLRFTIIS